MVEKPIEMCHCGTPLHYSSPEIKHAVERLIAATGPYRRVTSLATRRTYWVQVHFIALHGIKEQELHTYGFRDVTDVELGKEDSTQ